MANEKDRYNKFVWEDGDIVHDPVYWRSPVGTHDDFGRPIHDEFVDGKTKLGPWAMMSPESFAVYGTGRLGTGRGQRYKKQPDGKWLKVEG